MYKSLNNKVALVTGAGTGIGRAIAQRLADEGANVLIVGRTETTLVETAAYSDKISYLAIDLESEDGIRTIIRTVGERYGRLDILVNNAGWAPVTPFATMKIDEYDKVFAINVRAVVMLTQAFLPMIKAAKGNILNVTTTMTTNPIATMANYAASKAGIIGMTKAAAKELAPRGITVNAVAPGFIDTAMTDALPDSAKEAILSRIASGAFGAPEDVANAVAFFAQPESEYITGQVLCIDGGMSL